jgi:hypothetical protein
MTKHKKKMSMQKYKAEGEHILLEAVATPGDG